MEGEVKVVTKPIVNVRITSTITSMEMQGRFNRGISIAELKVRLRLPHIMHLTRWPYVKIIVLFLPSSCFLETYQYLKINCTVLFTLWLGKVGAGCGRICFLHGPGVVQCLWQVPSENGWQWRFVGFLCRGWWLQNTRMLLLGSTFNIVARPLSYCGKIRVATCF